MGGCSPRHCNIEGNVYDETKCLKAQQNLKLFKLNWKEFVKENYNAENIYSPPQLEENIQNPIPVEEIKDDNIEVGIVNTKKTYKMGDRIKAGEGKGCNFRMNDGSRCDGGLVGKSQCVCKRHNSNLHLDLTSRGIYPLKVGENSDGISLCLNLKNDKTLLVNKDFMLPTCFNEFKESSKVLESDLTENPLIYVLHIARFYKKINRKKDRGLFSYYYKMTKSELINIFRTNFTGEII